MLLTVCRCLCGYSGRDGAKVNGSYVLDQDDVVARMKAYLDRADHVRAV